MTESMWTIGISVAAGIVVGGVVGWYIRSLRDKRNIARINFDWQLKFGEASRQRDRLGAENRELRSSIEDQQGLVHKHELAASRGRTELASAEEKIKAMAKDIVELGVIRDRLKSELRASENKINTVRSQVADLHTEFEKSGVFYKGELAKSFEKRKAVETKLDDLRAERDSLETLLAAAKEENESITRALESAQRRLENVDDVERSAIELEAENAELRHDAIRLRQEIEAMKREARDLEALKVQNRELAHCLKSMENSRKQYEIDAKRYREQAELSEKMSDTLRLKLDDVEKNLAEMAEAQAKAEKIGRNGNGHDQQEEEARVEVDDLTRIVGIGKVFQKALNDIGIHSFRQIANFGPSDIARVNHELKEIRGRMEQDDWIGQAKELYFQKYSEMVEH